jgi:hypothetical protein
VKNLKYVHHVYDLLVHSGSIGVCVLMQSLSRFECASSMMYKCNRFSVCPIPEEKYWSWRSVSRNGAASIEYFLKPKGGTQFA